MKKYRATKPTHNSGGDNKLFSDNLRALEDLYDLHESFKNTTNEKKTSAADARARDRAEGDAIRDASLGLFVAASDGGTSEDDDEKENDNPETPAAAALKKKKVIVSVLVLLVATALAKATTRLLNHFLKSILMKKRRKTPPHGIQ
jgi:hypothetical protein